MKNFNISRGGLCGLILIAAAAMNCFASRQNNVDELRHTHITSQPSYRYGNDDLKHTHVMGHSLNRYGSNESMHTHVMDHSINHCDDDRLKHTHIINHSSDNYFIDELKHTHVMCRSLNRCDAVQPRVVTDHKNSEEVVLNHGTTNNYSQNNLTLDKCDYKKDPENLPQEPRYVSFLVGCKLRDISDIHENAEFASFSLFNKLGSFSNSQTKIYVQ